MSSLTSVINTLCDLRCFYEDRKNGRLVFPIYSHIILTIRDVCPTETTTVIRDVRGTGTVQPKSNVKTDPLPRSPQR